MPETIPRAYSRVTFLLGAGASVDAGCPTVEGLVGRFESYLEEHAGAQEVECARLLQELIQSSEAVAQGRQLFDIELLLSTIVQLIERDRNPLQPFIRQWHRGVQANAGALPRVLTLLQDHIRKECTIKAESVGYLWPLKDFADLYGALDIFSLNYDAGIEITCQQRDLRYTDGFDLYWNPVHFESDAFKVRLFKLHGSLLWYETESRPRRLVKIPVHPSGGNELSFFTEEKVANLLMYPAFVKRQHVEPYATLMNHLRAALRESRVLIAVGCSFRDEYLKELVLEKMIENPELQLVVVDPNGAAALAHSDVTLSADLLFSSVAQRISFVHQKAAVALAGGLLLDHVRQVEELPDLKIAHEKAVLSGEDRRVQTDLGTPTGVAYAQRLIATRSAGAIAAIVGDSSDPFQLADILGRIVGRANAENIGGGDLAAVAIVCLGLSQNAEVQQTLREWLERKFSWVFQYVVWFDGTAYHTNTNGVGKPRITDIRAFFQDHAQRIRDFSRGFEPWAYGMNFHLPEPKSAAVLELSQDVEQCIDYFERSAIKGYQVFQTTWGETEFPRSSEQDLMQRLNDRFGQKLPKSALALLGTPT